MPSILTDKSRVPDDKSLGAALGPAFRIWTDLRSAIDRAHGPVTPQWKHYGAKSGWTLKLLRGKRNLFFMAPGKGRFTVAFVFGDRAVDAVAASDLPRSLIAELRGARRYAEGRGLRLEVSTRTQAARVLTLVDIKVHH